MSRKNFIPSRMKILLPVNKVVGGSIAKRRLPLGLANDKVLQNLTSAQKQMTKLTLTNRKPLRLML